MSGSRRSTIVVLLLLAAVLLGVAFVTYRAVIVHNEAESDAGQALFGDENEAVRYTTVAGAEVLVEDLVGETVLYINSWASWSPLSREELIALNQVAGEYKDRDVTFVALNRSEPKEMAERYLATLPSLDNLQVVIDATDHFYGSVGGYAMPETLIYDEQGNLWRHERQPLAADQIRTILDEVLRVED